MGVSFAILMEILSVVHAAETVIITDVAGSKTVGELSDWSTDEIWISSETKRKFQLVDVRTVEFQRSSKKNTHQTSMVILSNGDRITTRPVSVSQDSLTVAWSVLGESATLKIPLEHVVAMVFEWPAATDERLRLLADFETLPRGSDLVMLKNGDRMLGELERFDASFVEWKGATSSLKLDRSRIRAIRLNPELTTAKRPAGQRIVLTLMDGSLITSSKVELIDGLLKMKSLSLGNIAIPLDAVVACHLFSEQLIPLSDYEPVKVEFTPYLSTVWPLLRNTNVQRGPLSLRGTEFITGLGMHSRMSVSYDLRGHEREFQATVGIDDVANGRGSVVFGVELDGKRVWTSPELTGKLPALDLPSIPLQGGKRLTLIVEYGQFADVADYADWCNAVLIGKSSR